VFAFIQAYSGQGGRGLSPHVGAGFALWARGAVACAVPGAGADADADAVAEAVADDDSGAIVGSGAATEGGAGASWDGEAVTDAEGGSLREQLARGSDVMRGTKQSAVRTIRGTIATRRCGMVWLQPDGTSLDEGRGQDLMTDRTFVELIAAKRDGQRLSPGEIERLVGGLASGDLAEYQMSAWLMAVFFRGLDDGETVALTEAMLRSGRTLDLSRVPGIKVDKHSTGGVGDKVSIALAPLVAACGVPVPMVSGRGLGHTGGTLDKLEAIPGFRIDLTAAELERNLMDIGCCMIGQTAEIAPADKRIYALRDVTATVESIPLIVASILSKKLAEGIDALVLDVKVGRGAFMREERDARTLAETLVRVGSGAGKRVVALLTDMESPLGVAVGNAVEAREALDVLAGGGPADVVECTLRLGAEMLVLGGGASSEKGARAKLAQAIGSGEAARTAERMIQAQGGDPRVVADRARIPVAPEEVVVDARTEGFVVGVDALEVGLAAVAMGAGRTRADQSVDHGVGILVDAKPGTRVSRGQSLARLLVRHRGVEAIAQRVRAAFTIDDTAPRSRPLVLGRISGANSTETLSCE
jgi:pyrimidine-nucleoside phosphorylase